MECKIGLTKMPGVFGHLFIGFLTGFGKMPLFKRGQIVYNKL